MARMENRQNKREGGVMRLERPFGEINEEMFKKIVDNRSVKDENAEKTAQMVGLSAIKYRRFVKPGI